MNGGVGIAKEMHISTLTMKPNKNMMENLIEKDQGNNKGKRNDNDNLIGNANENVSGH